MEELIKKHEPKQECRHPEHEPATLKHREPGLYRHTCPNCRKKTEFEVPLITC